MISRAILALAAISANAAVAASASPRIVAVGDLHGDYLAWTDIARDARLVDAKGRWTGGKTILIQLGDVTDRGPDSLKIIRSLQQLARQAPRSGGQVIVLLGNHEAMNLTGDLRYTTRGELDAFTDAQSAARRDRIFDSNRIQIEAAFRAANPSMTAAEARSRWMAAHPLGWVEHRLAWKPTGELGRWAARNPVVVKIGDTLFVHGGISAEYARLAIAEINRRAATSMAAGDDSARSILSDPLGPLWYRGLVGTDPDANAARAAGKGGPPKSPEEELSAVLSTYGAKRMVVGHTPSLAGIQLVAGGRLVRIDTGISRFYGGPLSWLEIESDRVTPHTVQRSAR